MSLDNLSSSSIFCDKWKDLGKRKFGFPLLSFKCGSLQRTGKSSGSNTDALSIWPNVVSDREHSRFDRIQVIMPDIKGKYVICE